MALMGIAAINPHDLITTLRNVLCNLLPKFTDGRGVAIHGEVAFAGDVA